VARVSGQKSTNNFTRGLITEASPLTYPENAASEFQNLDINFGGRVRRRLGLDTENNGGYFANPNEEDIDTGAAISSFEWKAVGGQGDRNFQVIQIGYLLYFFDLAQATFSPAVVTASSGRIFYHGVTDPALDLSTFKVGTTITKFEMGFASGKGFLFVASPDIETVAIKYTPDSPGTPDFEVTQINIEIRDFDGIDESASLAVDERPQTLSKNHLYNLRNQGWPQEFRCARRVDGHKGSVNFDPVEYCKVGGFYDEPYNMLLAYPSNADIIYLGKMTAADDPENVASFHPSLMLKQNMGTTQAPRGHFILNAFLRDRTSAGGAEVIGMTQEAAIAERSGAVAFFGGRAWYAGTPNEDIGSNVYFSQLLTNIAKAGKCYQEQDPTAENLNSLLDTDGGVIPIPDVGQIIKMVTFADQLLIFASNGVWSIRGGADSGFTPSAFTIDFITNVGPISVSSIVEIDNGISYWADNGIYILAKTDTSINLVPTNITENTIETTYSAIDAVSKKLVRSLYDRDTKKIFWAYNSSPVASTSTTDTQYKFDRFLIFNVKIQAFYEYTVASLTGSSGWESPFVCEIVRKASTNIVPSTEGVFHNGEVVTVNVDPVTVTENLLETNTNAALKFLYLQKNPTSTSNYRFFFAEFRDTNFKDWATTAGGHHELTPNAGGDFESALETGFELLGDVAREKQIKWLMLHFDRTEQNFVVSGDDVDYDFPSSALVRVKFDFTSTATAGRWSDEYEAYRLIRDYWPDGVEAFDYSFDVISFKQRVRGHGRSVAYRVRSSSGKDLRLLGWDAEFTGRSRL
jgi:hypothetical protein|tara:strand:- start:4573 stop:6981 length:2409 start_codon:yes stop_codon:yes gene_type:complete